MLAAALASGTSVVSADVALDSAEPIVGSFTAEGLTYAVGPDGLTLVSVDASTVSDGALSIPESVAYDGMTYPVAAIGPYAFYLSGATQVSLPATIFDIDELAFRSSDVGWADVDSANPAYASYDGTIYSADLTRLLLIPGGRQGAVRIDSQAEEVPASAFSHCADVTAISADAGSAAYSSWEGLLYDASGQTLLRVPAGATDIAIREGCTTIAAGAMAGCAKLERIKAPTTVTSISPDAFESIPTISLPAMTLQDEPVAASFVGAESEESAEGATPNPVILSGGEAGVEGSPSQLTAMVALSCDNNSSPQVSPEDITVLSSSVDSAASWERVGCSVILSDVEDDKLQAPIAELQTATANSAYIGTVTVNGNGGTVTRLLDTDALSTAPSFTVDCYSNWALFGTGSLHYYRSDTSDFCVLSVSRVGYTFAGWSGSVNMSAGDATQVGYSSVSVSALWTANKYTVTLNRNGGSGGTGSVTATYDSNMPTMTKPSRAGFTFQGYYDTSAATGGTQYYTAAGGSARTWNKNSNSTLYARWSGNTITCTWNSQGGSSISNTSATYSTTAKVPMPSTNPTKSGYTFAGWWTAASGGTQVTSSTTLPTSNPTYHAHWSTNPYTITYELNGGSVAGNLTTYNVETDTFTLKNPTKVGYIFTGWSGTGLTGSDNTTVKVEKGSVDSRSYEAHWTPALSADVPLEVTARIDKLGIEEQTEASGYIKSLCGEPLKVAEVECESQAGAEQLFGSWADQVELRVATSSGGSAELSLPLGAAGFTVADGSPASMPQIVMASYGTSIPLYYRFAIPDDFPLSDLTEGTSSICQVSYTVALA